MSSATRSMNRFLPYAQLLRLPNVFTAMADIFLAGMSAIWFADQVSGAGIPWSSFGCVLLASCLLYWSGMVWNDYFDLEQDRRERSFRPLAAGIIPIQTARRLGIVLMAGGLLLAGLADLRPDGYWPNSSVIALLLILAILAYNAWLKRSGAGPWAMGACRFLNILLGLSAAGQGIFTWGWGLALVVGLYIVGVTQFARTEARVSDPNRLLFGALLLFAALILALTMPKLVQYSYPAHRPAFLFPYFLVAFVLYLCLAVIPAIQRPIPGMVQAAVKRSILGLILLDAILATAIVGYLGLAIVGLYLPSYFLGRWVYST